jgi:hypothetical protein
MQPTLKPQSKPIHRRNKALTIYYTHNGAWYGGFFSKQQSH